MTATAVIITPRRAHRDQPVAATLISDRQPPARRSRASARFGCRRPCDEAAQFCRSLNQRGTVALDEE
jgi:hypothetical protein